MKVHFDPALAWRSRRPFPGAVRRQSKVLVLKPHGSINWATTPEGDQLALEHLHRIFGFPFEQSYFASSDPEFPERPFTERTILAPVYTKAYHQKLLLPAIWDLAIAELSRASEITVIGYSLPPSDHSSRELLAYALRQNKSCDTINLVTPLRVNESEWGDFAKHSKKRATRVARSFEEWVVAAAGLKTTR
jgi:hypothetical protein